MPDVLTREPRLDRLPALTCWPEDGGPFVTLPLVYTEHPAKAAAGARHGSQGASNLGMYRLQVHGPRTTGMHWQIGKGGGFHHALAEGRQQALPVTVFLGGPPALILSAIAPLPENVPELMLASLIAGERLRLVRGHGPHPLVAEAEFALVGRVPPGVRRPEGPSATTTATTRCATTTRSSRSRPSRGGATPSTRPPWWASRARRTSSSATCCRSCSRRSSRWSCRP